MKKIIFTAILFIGANYSSAQLISGTLIEEGRKLTSPFDFKIKGNFTGFQYFILAVNSNGDVTSVKSDEVEGALISTPAKVLATKELKKLKFDGATYFPKFQHAKVRITYIK